MDIFLDVMPLPVMSSTGDAPPPNIDGHRYLPAAYRSVDPASRGPIATVRPHIVFIEVTKHCNVL